jgi:hypothetical protein
MNHYSRKRVRKLYPTGDRCGDRFGGFFCCEETPVLSWLEDDPDPAQLAVNRPSALASVTAICRLFTLSLR